MKRDFCLWYEMFFLKCVLILNCHSNCMCLWYSATCWQMCAMHSNNNNDNQLHQLICYQTCSFLFSGNIWTYFLLVCVHLSGLKLKYHFPPKSFPSWYVSSQLMLAHFCCFISKYPVATLVICCDIFFVCFVHMSVIPAIVNSSLRSGLLSTPHMLWWFE